MRKLIRKALNGSPMSVSIMSGMVGNTTLDMGKIDAQIRSSNFTVPSKQSFSLKAGDFATLYGTMISGVGNALLGLQDRSTMYGGWQGVAKEANLAVLDKINPLGGQLNRISDTLSGGIAKAFGKSTDYDDGASKTFDTVTDTLNYFGPLGSAANFALDTINALTGTKVKGVQQSEIVGASSSYGSVTSDMDKYGKDLTIGGFGRLMGSAGKRRKQIAKIQDRVNRTENLLENANDRLQASLQDHWLLRNRIDLNGGYQSLHLAKLGMKFPTSQEMNNIRLILSKRSGGNLLPPKPELLEILSEDPEVEEVPEFKKGGSTAIKEKNDESYQEFLKSLPKNLQELGISEDGYRMRYAFDNSPDVWTFEDAKGKFINWNYEDNSWHGSTVFAPTGEFLKSSSHPSTYMEVQWYKDHPGADDFRKKYKLVTTDEKGEPLKYFKYIKRNPEEIDLFRDGGSIIPAGALHKCKNHMELAKEGKITHKGIPVVTTDGSNEQQAEIECNEIIYQKSITQLLELLMKKYYSDEYTLKEKDLFAIEAGKLLVVETLENTEDHTGLIASIESELPID